MMIELPFGASLMTVVGAATLPAPGFRAAGGRCSNAVPGRNAGRSRTRRGIGSRTNPMTKNYLAMTIHVRPEAGLDNGARSWQVKTSLLCGYLLQVARLSARCVPAYDEELYQWQC
jgi:hypothetical protein